MTIAAIVMMSVARVGLDQAKPSIEGLGLAHQLTSDLARFVSTGRHYILSGDEGDRKQLLDLEARVKTSVASVAIRTKRMEASTEHPDSATTELEGSVDTIITTVDRAVRDRSTEMLHGDQESLDRLSRFEVQVQANRIAYDSALKRALDVAAGELEHVVERSGRFANQIRWSLLVGGALAILAGVILTLMSLREAESKSDKVKTVPQPTRTEVIVKGELRTQLQEALERLNRIDRHALAAHEASQLDEVAEIATRVDHQLDGLFDVARLENGAVALNNQRCSVEDLVGRAVQPFEASATTQGIRLRSECEANVVYVDKDRIVRVLGTLIGVAIGAGRAGAEVHVAAVPIDKGVRFSVTKLGTGTLPDSLTSLFGTAAAIPAPAWEHKKLDVHLCRRLVEAHGGRLGFEAAGTRTTCWFVVPTEPQLLRSS